jgi:hypothetical protein
MAMIVERAFVEKRKSMMMVPVEMPNYLEPWKMSKVVIVTVAD